MCRTLLRLTARTLCQLLISYDEDFVQSVEHFSLSSPLSTACNSVELNGVETALAIGL